MRALYCSQPQFCQFFAQRCLGIRPLRLSIVGADRLPCSSRNTGFVYCVWEQKRKHSVAQSDIFKQKKKWQNGENEQIGTFEENTVKLLSMPHFKSWRKFYQLLTKTANLDQSEIPVITMANSFIFITEMRLCIFFLLVRFPHTLRNTLVQTVGEWAAREWCRHYSSCWITQTYGRFT